MTPPWNWIESGYHTKNVSFEISFTVRQLVTVKDEVKDRWTKWRLPRMSFVATYGYISVHGLASLRKIARTHQYL